VCGVCVCGVCVWCVVCVCVWCGVCVCVCCVCVCGVCVAVLPLQYDRQRGCGLLYFRNEKYCF